MYGYNTYKLFLIVLIVFIKNVIILVGSVVNQEMIQIIIVMNVIMDIYLLMNLRFLNKIVIKNVISFIILMKQINILVLNQIYVLLNIINQLNKKRNALMYVITMMNINMNIIINV